MNPSHSDNLPDDSSLLPPATTSVATASSDAPTSNLSSRWSGRSFIIDESLPSDTTILEAYDIEDFLNRLDGLTRLDVADEKRHWKGHHGPELSKAVVDCSKALDMLGQRLVGLEVRNDTRIGHKVKYEANYIPDGTTDRAAELSSVLHSYEKVIEAFKDLDTCGKLPVNSGRAGKALQNKFAVWRANVGSLRVRLLSLPGALDYFTTAPTGHQLAVHWSHPSRRPVDE